MANPNSNELGKFQQLIIKNPLAFVAAVFFLMFWVTYYINLNSNKESKEDYKKLYSEERKKVDELNRQLLVKAGYIKDETIKKADSALREKTQEQATTLLNQKK